MAETYDVAVAPHCPLGPLALCDLIGLDVVNREGVHLGVVRDLMATGPNSVLVLEYPDTVDGVEQVAERMIPFVAAYIDNVDKASRRITAARTLGLGRDLASDRGKSPQEKLDSLHSALSQHWWSRHLIPPAPSPTGTSAAISSSGTAGE